MCQRLLQFMYQHYRMGTDLSAWPSETGGRGGQSLPILADKLSLLQSKREDFTHHITNRPHHRISRHSNSPLSGHWKCLNYNANNISVFFFQLLLVSCGNPYMYWGSPVSMVSISLISGIFSANWKLN